VLFEGLGFRLDPNDEVRFQFLTVVDVIGNGRCTFKQCLLTLVEGKKEETKDGETAQTPVRPSAVRLTYNPGEVMKMTPQPSRPTPQLRFEECFVRGQGDVVMVSPSRPLDLEVTNSLIALDGSLLHVDGRNKQPPDAPANATDKDLIQGIKLKKVTTFLSLPMLCLRGAKSQKDHWLIRTLVDEPANNLFVAADRKQPFIQFDDVESENQMARLIEWKGGTLNAYINFDKMLASPRSIEKEDWGKSETINISDENPRFAKGKFERDGDRPLSETAPNDFKTLEPKVDLQKYGVNLETLPKPAAEAPKEDTKDDLPKEESES
jgi:hypothetical protein